MGNCAEEYCLLWLNWWPVCMNKSEWASWIQAGGSLIALVITICLARSAQTERRRGALNAALLFAHRLDLMVIGLAYACKCQLAREQFKKKLEVLEDVIAFGRSIVASDLDKGFMNYFLRLRELGAELKWEYRPPNHQSFGELSALAIGVFKPVRGNQGTAFEDQWLTQQ